MAVWVYVNVRRVVRRWTKGDRLKAAMAMASGVCAAGCCCVVLLLLCAAGRSRRGLRAAMMAASSVSSS